MAHGFVSRRLENSGHSALARVGSHLTQLRRQRNRADYDLRDNIPQRVSVEAIAFATEIARTVDSLTADERRAAVEVIKIYETQVLRESTWRN